MAAADAADAAADPTRAAAAPRPPPLLLLPDETPANFANSLLPVCAAERSAGRGAAPRRAGRARSCSRAPAAGLAVPARGGDAVGVDDVAVKVKRRESCHSGERSAGRAVALHTGDRARAERLPALCMGTRPSVCGCGR